LSASCSSRPAWTTYGKSYPSPAGPATPTSDAAVRKACCALTQRRRACTGRWGACEGVQAGCLHARVPQRRAQGRAPICCLEGCRRELSGTTESKVKSARTPLPRRLLPSQQLRHEGKRVLRPGQEQLGHELVPQLAEVGPARIGLQLQHLPPGAQQLSGGALQAVAAALRRGAPGASGGPTRRLQRRTPRAVTWGRVLWIATAAAAEFLCHHCQRRNSTLADLYRVADSFPPRSHAPALCPLHRCCLYHQFSCSSLF